MTLLTPDSGAVLPPDGGAADSIVAPNGGTTDLSPATQTVMRPASTKDATVTTSPVASIPSLKRRMRKSLRIVSDLWASREIPSAFEPGWVHQLLAGAELNDNAVPKYERGPFLGGPMLAGEFPEGDA